METGCDCWWTQTIVIEDEFVPLRSAVKLKFDYGLRYTPVSLLQSNKNFYFKPSMFRAAPSYIVVLFGLFQLQHADTHLKLQHSTTWWEL